MGRSVIVNSYGAEGNSRTEVFLFYSWFGGSATDNELYGLKKITIDIVN